jgi:hypothetical protein
VLRPERDFVYHSEKLRTALRKERTSEQNNYAAYFDLKPFHFQEEILEKLIEILPLKLLRPFGDKFLYVKPLRAAIDELKREGLTPTEFAAI